MNANMSGDTRIGGMLGSSHQHVNIAMCEMHGNINGNDLFGALIGRVENGNVYINSSLAAEGARFYTT